MKKHKTMKQKKIRLAPGWYMGIFFAFACLFAFAYGIFTNFEGSETGIPVSVIGVAILSFLVTKVVHNKLEKIRGGFKHGLYILLGALLTLGGLALVSLPFILVFSRGETLFFVVLIVVAMLLATVLAWVDNIGPITACSRAFDALNKERYDVDD